MNTKFEAITSTPRAIKLLWRFERMKLPNMPFEEKHKFIIKLYNRDLDLVAKMYRTFRTEPFLPRNMPPVAGKIAWARQLYRRISDPMDVFKERPDLYLDFPDSKKTIKNFNRLARVLVEYELLYYRGWLRQVSWMLWRLVLAQVCCYNCLCQVVCDLRQTSFLSSCESHNVQYTAGN